MDIRTFRAKTMPQALELVRRELGPQATVLHTREHHGSLLGRVFFGRHYEIAATLRAAEAQAAVPLLDLAADGAPLRRQAISSPLPSVDLAPAHPTGPSAKVAEFELLLANLRARGGQRPASAPADLFDVFADLIEADFDEDAAREFVDALRRDPALDLTDQHAVRARLAALIAGELRTTGPIVPGVGAARVVALVGPTGVGKTTTIAKLAANFRLRENRRVGLITVDTYRIAAVEQLRTYAEIIDLPMRVVSTPREMREAVDAMRGFDLVLMDTAGRSPRDEVKIRELRAMLAEAAPDEVHLVLSATTSARNLAAVAEKFAPVGVTAAAITKLDEATGLGRLVGLARTAQLPISYLTDGQNVPDDISVADPQQFVELILGGTR